MLSSIAQTTVKPTGAVSISSSFFKVPSTDSVYMYVPGVPGRYYNVGVYGKIKMQLADSLKKLNTIDVYAIGGQSNAQGSSQDSISAPLVKTGVGLQYYLGAIRPVYKNVGSGNGGAWPAFINEIYNRNGKKILMVPVALGSTSQTAAAASGNGTWDVSGSLRTNLVSQVNAAMAAATVKGYTPVFKGILWSQGENDAGALFSGTITKATYATALATMISYYRSNFGSTMPFYIFRTGGQPGNTGFIPIRAVQDSIANVQPNTYMVFRDAVSFFERSLMRPDNLHYLQEGYNQMGVIGAINVINPNKLPW